MKSAAQLTIDELAAILIEASDKYYNTGNSSITDAEFDSLKDELKRRDPNHPFLAIVGAAPAGHLSKVKLVAHMGSQVHATTDEEFWDWYKKNDNPEVVITDKVDGCSVEIIYEGGVLKRVASRGDGTTGADISQNAVFWANLPKTVKPKSKLIIRGEAVLLKELWEKHFSDKANPRNAGTGICMRKSEPEANKYMNVYVFDIVTDQAATQAQKLKLLQALGFQTVRFFTAKDKQQVEKSWEYYNRDRNNLPYEIDGAVVCIQDLATQKSLGFVDNRPKGQIAWKFKAQEKITRVTGMTITMGKSGNVIPTAIVAPTYIGGVTIQNVLLTTFSRIEQLNVNIGDEVLMLRAGDVIPYLAKVLVKNSNGPYPRPVDCPYCKTKLEARGAYLVCPAHESCPGQQFRRIEGWIKKCDIKQFGTTLLEALYDSGKVKCIADIYRLDWNEVANVQVGNGVLGTSLANKIKAEVEKTIGMPVDEFIGSIGVKDLGRSTAKNMGLKKLAEFLGLTVTTAEGLPGIGAGKAGTIVASLAMFKNEIEELATLVKPADAQDVQVGDGPLKGTTWCFTGVRMSLSEAKKLGELGGTEKSGVSKGLTYLVCADVNTNSGKATKARDYGTKIVSMDEFKLILTGRKQLP